MKLQSNNIKYTNEKYNNIYIPTSKHNLLLRHFSNTNTTTDIITNTTTDVTTNTDIITNTDINATTDIITNTNTTTDIITNTTTDIVTNTNTTSKSYKYDNESIIIIIKPIINILNY